MGLRPYWSGNLRVSLVTFGVKMFSAVSGSARIQLNQIHEPCGNRIKQPPTCPEHGIVERREIIKGYEFESGRYVIIEKNELEAIKLASEKTIEIASFVPEGSVDDLYLDATYFVAPDGPLAQEPFKVIREALVRTKTAGIGRFTHGGREHAVLLRPREAGFTLTTLHTVGEVKIAEAHFEEITPGAVNPEHLKLAESLIKGLAGEFEPTEFRDRYQDALVALVQAKIAGQKPVVIHEEDIPPTLDFIGALKRSLGEEGSPSVKRVRPGSKKPAARSERARPTPSQAKRKRA